MRTQDLSLLLARADGWAPTCCKDFARTSADCAELMEDLGFSDKLVGRFAEKIQRWLDSGSPLVLQLSIGDNLLTVKIAQDGLVLCLIVPPEANNTAASNQDRRMRPVAELLKFMGFQVYLFSDNDSGAKTVAALKIGRDGNATVDSRRISNVIAFVDSALEKGFTIYQSVNDDRNWNEV